MVDGWIWVSVFGIDGVEASTSATGQLAWILRWIVRRCDMVKEHLLSAILVLRVLLQKITRRQWDGCRAYKFRGWWKRVSYRALLLAALKLRISGTWNRPLLPFGTSIPGTLQKRQAFVVLLWLCCGFSFRDILSSGYPARFRQRLVSALRNSLCVLYLGFLTVLHPTSAQSVAGSPNEGFSFLLWTSPDSWLLCVPVTYCTQIWTCYFASCVTALFLISLGPIFLWENKEPTN